MVNTTLIVGQRYLATISNNQHIAMNNHLWQLQSSTLIEPSKISVFLVHSKPVRAGIQFQCLTKVLSFAFS